MRTINLKLIVWILSGTGLLAGIVFAVHAFQYQRIPAALLFQAHKAEHTTPPQLDRVVRYLKRYLEFAPRDLEEKAKLARIMATDYPGITPRARLNAVNLLDSVLATDPTRDDLRLLLIKTSLELNNPKLAREHLEWLWPERDKEPGNRVQASERGEIELYWGELYELEKKYPEAMAKYRQSIEHSPKLLLSYARLAQILRQKADKTTEGEKNLAEADRLMDELVSHNETSAEAYLMRWNYRRQYDLIRVEKTRDESDKPRNRIVVRNTSRDAAEDVTRALQRAPSGEGLSAEQLAVKVDVKIAAGEVERLLGNTDESGKHLKEGLQLVSKPAYRSIADGFRPVIYWHLVNLMLDGLFDEKKNPESRNADAITIANMILELRRYRNQSASADYLEGRMRVQERRWREAVALLKRAEDNIRSTGGQQALLIQIDQYLGMCYEQMEEPGEMAAAFNRILSVEPNNVAALVGKGSALRLQGQRENEALELYRNATSKGGLPTVAWLDITRLEISIQRQRADKAQREWRDAEEALRKAKEPGADGEAISAERRQALLLLEVELRTAQEEFAKGDALLRNALENEPKLKKKWRAELWAARCRLALEEKKPETAMALLLQAEKELGPVVQLRLARVEYWASVGKLPPGAARIRGNETPSEASQKLEEIEKGVSTLQDLGERARLLTALAEAQVQVGNDVATRRVCLQLAETPDHQSDQRLRLFLFSMAQDADDEEGMEKALQDLRNLEGGAQGVFYQYGQALRLLWMARHGKRDVAEATSQAAKHLDFVARVRPNWAPVHVARAEIAQIKDYPDVYVKELRQAHELGDNSPGVITRLARMLSQTDDGAIEAANLMKLLDPNLLKDPDLGRLESTIALRIGNPALALQKARDVVSINSKDYRDLIFLAEMESNSINPRKPDETKAKIAQARKLLDRAIELAPTNPDPYVALVNFLVNQESKNQALAIAELKEAQKKVDPKRWPLCKARCLEIIGDFAAARTAYQESLTQDQDAVTAQCSYIKFLLKMGSLADARTQLEKLIDPASTLEINPLDKAWARNALAMLLSTGTDFADFQKALALVEVKLDAAGNPITEREPTENLKVIRAQARVLATQPQKPFRDRALELFEVLRSKNNLSVDDMFIQAMLTRDAGNWPKAFDLLKQLAIQRNVNPQHLNFLIRGLLAQKDFDEAEKYLGQLKDLEKTREVSAGTFGSVELGARLLEGRKKGEDALALLRKYIEDRRRNLKPTETQDDLLLLLTSLSNQERFEEAFTMLEQVWKQCRPEVAGANSVSLLRQMKMANKEARDEQVQRVAEWLAAAVKKEPKKMVLRLQLADLMDQRGKYDVAVNHLREVIKDANEPNNVVALNNLAWLLAHNNEAEHALEYINKAIDGLGKRPELLDTRGVIYMNLGKTDKALADLKEATKDSTSANRLFHLARAHYLARDRDNAIKELTKARQLPLDQALNPNKLHPKEQEMCRRMLEELRVE